MEPTHTHTQQEEAPAQHHPGSIVKSPDDESVSRPPVDWHTTTSHPVFVIEDSFYRSRTPRSTHWSIAWSDLMMTMFVLFLTLFVYQLAHREFLSPDQVEVVGGSVMAVPPESDLFDVPFHPISPQLSDHKADKLRTVEKITEEELPEQVQNLAPIAPLSPIEQELVPETPPAQPRPEQSAPSIEVQELEIAQQEPAPDPLSPPQTQQSVSSALTPVPDKKEIFTEIYDLSKLTLSEENLERFASVELIPDKAMRIVLTGDLLFATGEAELTEQAKTSLGKLSPVIAQTPYMINVIGHTDSDPMHSARYPTNWELSVARASRVARFLVEDMQIPGTQIAVSGFSYFRPVRPNTTAENKRANRRVEIILSQKTPPNTQPNQTIPSTLRTP